MPGSIKTPGTVPQEPQYSGHAPKGVGPQPWVPEEAPRARAFQGTLARAESPLFRGRLYPGPWFFNFHPSESQHRGWEWAARDLQRKGRRHRRLTTGIRSREIPSGVPGARRAVRMMYSVRRDHRCRHQDFGARRNVLRRRAHVLSAPEEGRRNPHPLPCVWPWRALGKGIRWMRARLVASRQWGRNGWYG
jgi:hypothetical protein